MISESESEFRRDLIDRLASSPLIRPAAEGRMDDESAKQLAQHMGVTWEVLIVAVRVARMGLGLPPKMSLSVFVPLPVARALFPLAEQMGTTPGVLIRTTLHWAMLTDREPRPRDVGRGSTHDWSPLPGSERFRADLESRRPRRLFVHPKPKGTRSNDEKYHTAVDISVGLAEALQRRAAAYRCTRHQYVCQWIADLVDGVLSDLPMVLVRLVDCHPDERLYLLPAVDQAHPLIAEATYEETVRDADVYEDGGAK